MKITITLKDPDGFYEAVRGVALDAHPKTGVDDENEGARRRCRDQVWRTLERFVAYRENVTLEFDTDAGTATVVPRRP